MNTELEELYQEVILDHSRGRGIRGAARRLGARARRQSVCGDEIHLGVQFGPDGALEEIKFTGQGCAISQASASMMTMKLKGKSRAEADEMLRAFHDLVTADDAEPPAQLGDLRLLRGVRKFPQRVKCAMLAWRALEQALRQNTGQATVSTEGDQEEI